VLAQVRANIAADQAEADNRKRERGN
jgi:hypothetical protein